MAQWILKDTMKINSSRTIRLLTKDEHRDLNLIKERENFMEKCRLYHRNKIKLGNKKMPKVGYLSWFCSLYKEIYYGTTVKLITLVLLIMLSLTRV